MVPEGPELRFSAGLLSEDAVVLSPVFCYDTADSISSGNLQNTPAAGAPGFQALPDHLRKERKRKEKKL